MLKRAKKLLFFFFFPPAFLILFLRLFHRRATQEIKVKDLGKFKKENLVPDPSRKKKIENITIVELEGSPYEIGYQNGVLLKEEIGKIIREAYKRYLAKGSLKAYLVRALIMLVVKRVDKEIPLEYRQEMQGVADGAGLDYNDILLMNAFMDGFQSLDPILLQVIYNLSGLEPGCSSIIVHKGENSSHLIIGQTVDYMITLSAGRSVLYVVKTPGKQTIIMPSFPGLIGMLNGMNESGLVLTQRATPTGKGGVGMPVNFHFRRILEDSHSLDQARDYLNRIKWTASRSIIIADSGENKSSLFEILPGKGVKEIEIKKHAGAANHFKTEEFHEVQKAALKKYKFLQIWGLYEKYLSLYDNSLRRERYLQKFLENETEVTPEKIIKAISDYDPRLNIPGGTVSNQQTEQAMVFIPEEKTIYLANGLTPPVTQGGFVKIDLKKWF